MGVSFGSDENILELDRGCGCIMLWMYWIPMNRWTVHLKIVNFGQRVQTFRCKMNKF